MKKVFKGSILGLLTAVSLSLTGCGSGGGSPATTSTTTSANTVSGVAATGAPMSGTVYLKDSAGNPEMSTQINPQTGAFVFDVNGKTPPFMIRAGSLYTMSNGPGTSNINPLSHLMVANMGSFTNMSTMNSFYKNPNATQMKSIFENMSSSRQQMMQKMAPLFSAYGVSNVNPISSPYSIGNALDKMFDNVHMSIDQNGNVSMDNWNGATIYSGPMGNMGNCSIYGNITPPTGTGSYTSGITISPSHVTLQVNGSLQFSANVPVTWSVGQNSGSITSDGLYTAPPDQGMYLVKATSTTDPTKFSTATVYVGSGGMGMGMMW